MPVKPGPIRAGRRGALADVLRVPSGESATDRAARTEVGFVKGEGSALVGMANGRRLVQYAFMGALFIYRR